MRCTCPDIFIWFTVSFSHTQRIPSDDILQSILWWTWLVFNFPVCDNNFHLLGGCNCFRIFFPLCDERCKSFVSLCSHPTLNPTVAYIGNGKVLDYWNLSHAHDTHTHTRAHAQAVTLETTSGASGDIPRMSINTILPLRLLQQSRLLFCWHEIAISYGCVYVWQQYIASFLSQNLHIFAR